MQTDLRMQLQIARTSQYGDIMRTALFGQIALAAIIGFGAEGINIPLAIAVIATTAYGALGGAAALEDIAELRKDMDEATAGSAYGKHAHARNLGLLKTLTNLLLGLTGLGLLIAIST